MINYCDNILEYGIVGAFDSIAMRNGEQPAIFHLNRSSNGNDLFLNEFDFGDDKNNEIDVIQGDINYVDDEDNNDDGDGDGDDGEEDCDKKNENEDNNNSTASSFENSCSNEEERIEISFTELQIASLVSFVKIQPHILLLPFDLYSLVSIIIKSHISIINQTHFSLSATLLCPIFHRRLPSSYTTDSVPAKATE